MSIDVLNTGQVLTKCASIPYSQRCDRASSSREAKALDKEAVA
jgi:hypothetical protein